MSTRPMPTGWEGNRITPEMAERLRLAYDAERVASDVRRLKEMLYEGFQTAGARRVVWFYTEGGRGQFPLDKRAYDQIIAELTFAGFQVALTRGTGAFPKVSMEISWTV